MMMNKHFVIIGLFLFTPFLLRGQNRIGSVGLGIGGSFVSESGINVNTRSAGGGINLFLNLMFNVSDRISTGIELNGNVAVLVGTTTSGFKFEATEINGILAKGRYMFQNNRTTPFIGAMIGIYNIKPGGTEIRLFNTPVNIDFDKKTSFGFAPEFGVKIKSFQIALLVHIPGKYKLSVPDGQGGTVDLENRYTAWVLNIGWNIGFGWKSS